MTYSTEEIDRIAQIAFDLAKNRKRKLCSVDKANVLDVSQLWRERIEALSLKNKELSVSHL